MQQLSAEDAGFVYLEGPGTPMHVGFLGIYDPATSPGGAVRFKDILRHVGGRLARAPAFRRRVVRVPLDLDHPHWIEDPDFNLEYHVRHIALPRPADWRQLCIQVSRLHARPIDLNRPLWEVTIIEGLDAVAGFPPGCFALFAKTHLAAFDADYGDRMIAALHDLAATDCSPEAGPEAGDDWQPDSRPGITDLLVSSYFNTLRKPFQFAETLARSLPGLARRGAARVRGKVETPAAETAPATPFSGAIGPHRVFDSVALPLAGIRRIAALVPGSDSDDVILTIIGGALHDYLAGRDALPDDTLQALHPLQFQALVVPVGSQIEQPVERLRFVSRAADRARTRSAKAETALPRNSDQGFAADRAANAARLQARIAAEAANAHPFNVVIADVTDSGEARYLCGARLVHSFNLMPVVEPIGLVHTLFAAGDEIAISFTADRDKLPDPAAYAAALRANFAALQAAADAAQPAAPAAAPAPSMAAPHMDITTRKRESANG